MTSFKEFSRIEFHLMLHLMKADTCPVVWLRTILVQVKSESIKCETRAPDKRAVKSASIS